MNLALYVIVIAATFGVCYLFDKGFQKVFRGKSQHRSGLSVRLNKMYSVSGVVLSFLGVCAILVGTPTNNTLFYGGIVVLLMGIFLCIYHLSFGVFYDEDSFVYAGFGKKDVTYRFCQIRSQQLYVITGGSIVVELHMDDGNTVSIHSTMVGAYPFLDAAFHSWCRQKGIDAGSCDFHDPANHLWFPVEEV